MSKILELRQKRSASIEAMAAISDAAAAEERDLSADEQTKYDELKATLESLAAQIARLEEIETLQVSDRSSAGARSVNGAATVTRFGADNERNALNHWFRTGDTGGVRHMLADDGGVRVRLPEHRAVTDSTMNIATAGDGGNVVPTGFVGRVAQRIEDMSLANKLPVQRIQGTAATVDFPVQSADAQVFATTAEQADAHNVAWERDALQVGKTSFTLVWKTKVVELTLQLLQNNAVDLDGFIANVIGQAVGLTQNAALVTEALANGSAVKTFAGAAAIAAGEPEDMVFHATLGKYLEDDSNVSWLMARPTYGAIAKLTGNSRQYVATPQGTIRNELLGYPVAYSGSVPAIGASNKSLILGNWNYMGLYENPELSLLRDPYSVAGLVLLKYHFAFDFGTLQAGAIGYGTHPTS